MIKEETLLRLKENCGTIAREVVEKVSISSKNSPLTKDRLKKGVFEALMALLVGKLNSGCTCYLKRSLHYMMEEVVSANVNVELFLKTVRAVVRNLDSCLRNYGTSLSDLIPPSEQEELVNDLAIKLFTSYQQKLSEQLDELKVLDALRNTDVDFLGDEKAIKEFLELIKSTAKAQHVFFSLSLPGVKFDIFLSDSQVKPLNVIRREMSRVAKKEFGPEISDAFLKLLERKDSYSLILKKKLLTHKDYNSTCPHCPLKERNVVRLKGTVYCPVLSDLKITSLICYPIYLDGKMVGTIQISHNSTTFSPFVEKIIKVVSTSIGNLAEKLLLYKKMEKMATMDTLTQIYNRKYMNERLKELIGMYRRYGSPFAVLFMDIDHFKKFNDTYGHLLGDDVLRTVAMAIKYQIRATDIFGRYGGEEFLVLLPNSEAEAAVKAAEKIRETVEKTEFYPIADKKQKTITVSIGVAVFGLHARSFDDILKKADMALYHAKKTGRNKVVLFNEKIETD